MTYRHHVVAVHQADHLGLVQVLLVPDGVLLLLAISPGLVGVLSNLQLLEDKRENFNCYYYTFIFR